MNTEILNKYIELINKGYCSDCNELNCLGNFPHKDVAKNIKAILEENKKCKELIDEANKWVRNYMNEWDINDEVRQDLNDLLILLEEVE